MPRKGTKAENIMRLYAKGLSTTEIAEIVGCLPEYVRVVARQRKGWGLSENDRRYRDSPRGQEMMKRVNEAKREARKARRAYREASHA